LITKARFEAYPSSLPSFSFGTRGAKEKVIKKKTPFGGVSPVATGDQGSAFGNRELLKKFDQNFLAWGAVLTLQ
jgi:hypothetical protein